ncbi:unnamed protein product [Calypogeia fissa]
MATGSRGTQTRPGTPIWVGPRQKESGWASGSPSSKGPAEGTSARDSLVGQGHGSHRGPMVGRPQKSKAGPHLQPSQFRHHQHVDERHTIGGAKRAGIGNEKTSRKTLYRGQ